MKELLTRFPVLENGALAQLLAEDAAWEGVKRICAQVREDLELVTGRRCALRTGAEDCAGPTLVLAATAGRSPLLEKLEAAGLVSLADVAGKREVWLTQVLDRPLPELGAERVLLIAGSDKRGTIYGLLHLSELCGVSPLVYWGDVTPLRRETVVLDLPVREVTKEPSVRYRGFFINDEWPAFGNWCLDRFGGVNAKAYEQIFLLLLRLRGNYLWPAMWRTVFSEEGPGLEAARLADLYGVVMGTSHHEPLCRAGEEWKRVWRDYGTDPAWSFVTNSQAITAFWAGGLERNKGFENVYTIGMRGEDDSKLLSEDATMADNVGVLKKAVLAQHELLRTHVDPELERVPRMLAIYKEVEEFYYGDETCPGLRDWEELEDVIFLLSDDNFGNTRTLPDPAAPPHPGGYGMYYHFDYHGGPISYEWLNGNPLAKVWEQMTQAWDHGVREMWIVNVGDLKGAEFPLSYFLALAYDFDAWGSAAPGRTGAFTRRWTAQQFGLTGEANGRAAALMTGWSRLNALRRPEALDPEVYHPIHWREGERVWQTAQDLAELAEALGREVRPERRTSYWGMAGYPALLTANLVQLHVEAGWNHALARRGAVAANGLGASVKERIRRDRELVEAYHALAGGKWDHILASIHMDFRTWDGHDWGYPTVWEVTPIPGPKSLVSVRGSDTFHLGQHWQDKGPLVCDDFLHPGVDEAVLDIDCRGSEDFTYQVSSDRDWLTCSPAEERVSARESGRAGVVLACRRDRLPVGDTATVRVEIAFAGGQRTRSVVEVLADVPPEDLPAGVFLERRGYVAMDAAHYLDKRDAPEGGFAVIPDLGRAGDGVKALPAAVDWTQSAEPPYLHYAFLAEGEGTYTLALRLLARNPARRGGRMAFAVALNGEARRTVYAVSGAYRVGDGGEEWGRDVLRNEHTVLCPVQVRRGRNDLCICAGEPGVVLERIELYPADRPLAESYMGPPESWRGKT